MIAAAKCPHTDVGNVGIAQIGLVGMAFRSTTHPNQATTRDAQTGITQEQKHLEKTQQT